MSIQLPEARLFKVLLQDVSTRRQHVSISGSGWAASRVLKRRKWLSWVGEEGGQGEKKQPRFVLLAVSRDISHPRRMPSPGRPLR